MVVACSACNHRFEGGGYRDETCPACGAIAVRTRACPRCATPLGATRVEELVFDACGGCGGVFIDHATIQRAVAEHADAVLEALPKAGAALESTPTATCPSCAVAMEKRMASGGSGVILDVCKPHGVFFDAGELQTLIAFARREAARADREGHLRYRGPAEPVEGDPVSGLEIVAGGVLLAARAAGGPVGLVAGILLAAIAGAREEMQGETTGHRPERRRR